MACFSSRPNPTCVPVPPGNDCQGEAHDVWGAGDGHRQDAVVELDAALLGGENAAAVKLKRLLVRLDADRHGLRAAWPCQAGQTSLETG